MMCYARMVLAVTLSVGASGLVFAGDFAFQRGVTLESGDTWTDGRDRFRLFGVQSCLRGTSFTNGAGLKMDCGDASLAVLAAFINDIRPLCSAIAKASEVTYVICYGSVGGNKIDLGTALISAGYAFAALDRNGLPANPAYAVAEQRAREAGSGLWRYPDVEHPSLVLGRAAVRGRR